MEKVIFSYGDFGYCPKCGADLTNCYEPPEFDDDILFRFHCKSCGTDGAEVYRYEPSHTEHYVEE